MAGETLTYLEQYQQNFGKLYAGPDFPRGKHPHYIFACHAAYPSVITADLLYQIWYNFRSYKLPGGRLEVVPFEAVNDFLLSSCCDEIGGELYKVHNEIRTHLMKDLKALFGMGHFERVVRFLDQYTERNTELRYADRAKNLHQETVSISLDPTTALRKFSETLAKDDLTNLDLIRLRVKLDTHEFEHEAFRKLNKLVKGAIKDLSGEKQEEIFNLHEGGLGEIPDFIEQKLSSALTLNRNIDLSGKGLTEIPQEVLNEPSIQVLNLSNNQIKSIPQALANLTDLRQLNLNNNPHLDVYSFDWSALQDLEVLQLSRTDLNSLPSSIGLCQNLRQLKLYRNELFEFPQDIIELFRLELLDLSYNQIPSIPDWIAEFSRLKRLHLEWNLITQLPENIGELKRLEVLQVHANNLQELPQSISKLNSLSLNEQEHKYLMGLRLELNPFPFSIPPENQTLPPQALISYMMKEQETVGQREQLIVHTLLIGIDKYLSPGFSTLAGCVSDARKMADALSERYQESHDLRLHTLYDQEATKDGIVKALEMIISTALTGDKVLLYFGGHSHYEKTHRQWDTSQKSDLLQGLTCYDSTLDGSGQTLLSGLELRYLYEKLSNRGASVIAIFDTHYNGIFKENPGPERNPLPKRNWEQFIFSQEKFNVEMQKAPTRLETFLPEGNSIEIYATSGDEQAYEVANRDGSKSGVFTRAFIRIMRQSEWRISYASLQKRLQESLAKEAQKQTPNIFAVSHLASELYNEFISGKEIENPIEANLTFNPFKGIWSIDLGSLHGVTMDQNISIGVSTDTGLQTAGISRVLTSSSEIAFSNETSLSGEEEYRGFILGMRKELLKIYLRGDKEGLDLYFKYQSESSKKELLKGINLVDNRPEANYELLTKDNEYQILSVGDERPMIEALKGYSYANLDIVFQYLQHIREWRSIQDLKNPDSKILEESMISFYLHPIEGEPRKLTSIPEVNYLDVSENEFRLEFRNESKQTFYLAALYMSSQFAVIPDFLGQRVAELPPGEQIFVKEGRTISNRISNYVTAFNWEEEMFTVKLMLSTEPFDASVYKLEELSGSVIRRKSSTRSLESDPSEKNPEYTETFNEASDWLSINFGFRTKNPDYKPEENEDLPPEAQQQAQDYTEQEEWDEYDGYEMEE